MPYRHSSLIFEHAVLVFLCTSLFTGATKRQHRDPCRKEDRICKQKGGITHLPNFHSLLQTSWHVGTQRASDSQYEGSTAVSHRTRYNPWEFLKPHGAYQHFLQSAFISHLLLSNLINSNEPSTLAVHSPTCAPSMGSLCQGMCQEESPQILPQVARP